MGFVVLLGREQQYFQFMIQFKSFWNSILAVLININSMIFNEVIGNILF